MKNWFLGPLMVLLMTPFFSYSQDEIDIDDFFSEDEEEIDYTFATFKTTRLVNGHSIEHVGKGVLDFRISHRFGPPTEGRPFYNFLGLDQANIRLSLEYGIINGIMVGLGRSKDPGKAIDGFVKAKLLRQSKGARKMPLAVSYFGSAVRKTADVVRSDSLEFPSSGRWYFTHQLLIAKKFNERLSLQLAPTLIHRNLVKTREEANDVLSLGFGSRYMITGGVSLNLEWFYAMPDQLAEGSYFNSFAIGFDIETGGHVFQLHFTNAVGMTEPAFITETVDAFKAPGIRFGFNLSRVFTMVSPH